MQINTTSTGLRQAPSHTSEKQARRAGIDGWQNAPGFAIKDFVPLCTGLLLPVGFSQTHSREISRSYREDHLGLPFT